MGLAFLQLMLLTFTAALTLGATEANDSSFCPIINSLDCFLCAFRSLVNGTPPMLMAPRSGKTEGSRKSGNQAAGKNTENAASRKGHPRSSAKGQKKEAQTAADESKGPGGSKDKEKEFSCKVGDANVDWFIAIKGPQSHDYAYISSSTTNFDRWQFGGNITQHGPVAHTLRQALEPDNQSFVQAYSDAPPPKNTTYNPIFGHMKGLFMQGKTVGFWMMHSTRHFPSFDPPSLYQDRRYAQSFICITARSRNINYLSLLLVNSKPRYYKGDGPPAKTAKIVSVHEFKSKDDKEFHVFIKRKINETASIFEKIRKSYRSAFRVQSWITTSTETRSDHGNSLLNNVKSVKMRVEKNNEPWHWNTTTDHSKWCVSKNENIVCLSDLNRVQEHLNQGGTAVCLNDTNVWKAFNNLVDQIYTKKGR